MNCTLTLCIVVYVPRIWRNRIAEKFS